MKTILHDPKAQPRKWFLIDAAGKTLGHIATEAAVVLRGKNKPTFTPHIDCGDGIVIINVEQINLTGDKWAQKKYYSHSGYAGGLKTITAEKLQVKKPTEIMRHAVAGMLPKTRLKQAQLERLRIFTGAEHDLAAQQPETLLVA